MLRPRDQIAFPAKVDVNLQSKDQDLDLADGLLGRTDGAKRH